MLVLAPHDRSVHVGLALLLGQLRLVQLSQFCQTGSIQMRAGGEDDQRSDRHREKELKTDYF